MTSTYEESKSSKKVKGNFLKGLHFLFKKSNKVTLKPTVSIQEQILGRIDQKREISLDEDDDASLTEILDAYADASSIFNPDAKSEVLRESLAAEIFDVMDDSDYSNAISDSFALGIELDQYPDLVKDSLLENFTENFQMIDTPIFVSDVASHSTFRSSISNSSFLFSNKMFNEEIDLSTDKEQGLATSTKQSYNTNEKMEDLTANVHYPDLLITPLLANVSTDEEILASFPKISSTISQQKIMQRIQMLLRKEKVKREKESTSMITAHDIHAESTSSLAFTKFLNCSDETLYTDDILDLVEKRGEEESTSEDSEYNGTTCHGFDKLEEKSNIRGSLTTMYYSALSFETQSKYF